MRINRRVEFDLSTADVLRFIKETGPLDRAAIIRACVMEITDEDLKDLEDLLGKRPAFVSAVQNLRTSVREGN